MNQFLGETDSYLSLDRVTLEPPSEIPPPPPPSHDQARSSQEETQTLQGAREQLEAMAKQASQNQASVDTARGTTEGPADHGAAAVNPQSANPFDGRSPAQSFEDRIAAASMTPQPEAVSQPNHSQDLAPDNFIDRAAETMAAPTSSGPRDAKWGKRDANATYDGLNALDSDSTLDVLDLEKLDIFEGLEDIDELSQIEVIEDVIIPAATDTTSGATSSTANSDAAGWQAKPKYKTSEHAPAVSSDDLHDLIKSRIKKAEEPHEQHRVEGFITGAHDKVSVKDAGQNPLTKDPLTKDPVAKESGEKPAAPSDSQTASTTGETAAPPVPTAKELEALRQGARNKFVGGKAASGPPSGTASSVSNDSLGGHSSASTAPSPVMSARTVPPEIRKACMILGVRPEDMTIKEVNDKWKAQMAGGAHPDQGGDTESAIYLNTAKDTLVKWLNDQAPKLGKKFGK